MPFCMTQNFYKWSAFGYTLFIFLPVVLGILCTMLIHEEKQNDVLKQLWIVPVSKAKYLFSKFFVVLVYSVGFMMITALASVLFSVLPGYVAFDWGSVLYLLERCFEIGVLTAFAMLPITYPIGFLKHVKLSEGEQAKIAEILFEITGYNKERILQEVAGITPGGSDNYTFQIGGDGMQQDGNGGFTIGSGENQQSSPEKMTFAVRDDMDYARFKELMGQADDLLGGGSNYAVDSLIGYGTVPLTYEEAKERYDLAVSSDQVTGGYARLFSDYAGVMVLSILPVFLAVILSMKDRRAKMEALNDFGWLMPSVMISTAIGLFLTELTGTPIAVVVQGLWWMLDVNLGIKTVHSGYSLLRLTPRHNAGPKSLFHTQDYLDHFQNLVQNRLLMVGISLALIILTILIYEAKRKGKFGGNAFFKKAVSGIRNCKNQSQA